MSKLWKMLHFHVYALNEDISHVDFMKMRYSHLQTQNNDILPCPNLNNATVPSVIPQRCYISMSKSKKMIYSHVHVLKDDTFQCLRSE